MRHAWGGTWSLLQRHPHAHTPPVSPPWPPPTPTHALTHIRLPPLLHRFHCHYDEAFSSLQVPHFKGFLRLHITRSGDLELFGLALERVPHSWREDPRWRTPHGGGNRDAPAHTARFPSRCAARWLCSASFILPACSPAGPDQCAAIPLLCLPSPTC